MTENAIAKEIVDAAFRIHTALGPGLLESVYDAVLSYELGRRGLRIARQQPIPVVYENIRIDTGFRADLIVEDKVIVEIKSVEVVVPVHKKQLLTYLRLADKRLGLLINFQVALIKDGITRIVNGLEDEPHAKPPRHVSVSPCRFEVEDLARTVQEDDRAARCREQQGLPGVWTALQLSEVSRFEVGPLCDIVSEPAAQFGTRSGIFRPARQMQGIFPDPARPQPFHEELLSGGSCFMVVNAMEVNHFGAP